MTQNPTASHWATARGAKWAASLRGTEAMLAPVDAPLVAALALDGPYRLAEVGSGGGATALEVLRQAPSGSVVHGFDVSPDLVDVARKRVPAGEHRVAFQVADMSIAAPDAPYDRLYSRFGVMFFDEPRTAFANLARWLVPGGRFAFAVWGPLGENPWMAAVRDVVASIVELPPAPPDAPGGFRYGDVARLVALLEGAGLRGLHVRDWRGTLPVGGELSAAEAARFAIGSFQSYAEVLASAGDAATAEAQRALTARFEPHQGGGAVRLDARVHVVTGERPR